MKLTKPTTNEFNTFYQGYVSLVNEKLDLMTLLEDNFDHAEELLSGLTEEEANFRYARDKWSIKEIIGHIIDNERIMSYRALRFARNDQTNLSGYEQNDYVEAAQFNLRTLDNLLEEWADVRMATISLFSNFTEEIFNRKGTANNNIVTVKALLFIIIGHEIHHVNVLKDKYLKNIDED